jgi:hypothetical protein
VLGRAPVGVGGGGGRGGGGGGPSPGPPWVDIATRHSGIADSSMALTRHAHRTSDIGHLACGDSKEQGADLRS